MSSNSSVTFNQAKRAARSLAYRRRLNKGLDEIESTLRTFIRSEVGRVDLKEDTGVAAKLGPYSVKLTGGDLKVKEVSPINPNQLTFQFYKEEEEHE